jgi:hypothetical protein
MYKVHYRFDTIVAMVERMTGVRISRTSAIVGVRTSGVFGHRLGGHARRYYPFGALVVLPADMPGLPYTEQAEDPDLPPGVGPFSPGDDL